MMVDDELSDEYRTQLRDAVEASAAAEGDFAAFHARLDRAVSAKLDEIRRVAVAGHRSRAVAGAAWWDYAARTALAAVQLGLAAALLLLTYLRSGDGPAYARPSVGASTSSSLGRPSSARPIISIWRSPPLR